MRARWLLLFAVGVPACLFPGLDALTGGDASSPDVVVPTDAPSANDVTTADVIGDAGCDVAPDAAFCASFCPAPLFCDDFDIDSTFSRWTDGLLTSHGAGAILEGGISPPHYAQFTTGAFDAGQGFAECRTQLPATNIITVDLDANINTPSLRYGIVTIETTASPPNKQTRLFLDVSGTAFSLRQDIDLTDGGSVAATTQITSTVPSGWFHVTLTVDLTASTATLVVDKVTLASNVPINAAFVASPFTLRTGIYYVNPPGTYQKVQLDNVVVHAG